MRRPSSQRSTLSHALLPLFSLFLMYFVPSHYRPSDFIVIFKAREHCFIWEGFQSKIVSRCIIQQSTKKKSYFQPCQNNSDTFIAFCRLMDLDKQQKDVEEYLVFLGFMRKMAYLERVGLFFIWCFADNFCIFLYQIDILRSGNNALPMRSKWRASFCFEEKLRMFSF